MRRITIVLPDMDDWNLGKIQGIVESALAGDDRLSRALVFRKVTTYEIINDLSTEATVIHVDRGEGSRSVVVGRV